MTGPMDPQEQLTDPEAELLAGIRRVLGPQPSDQERVHLRLSASLLAGAAGPALPLGDPLGVDSTLLSRGIQGLTKQIIAAALIGASGFGLGFAAGRSGSPPDAAAPLASSAPVERVVIVPAAPSASPSASAKREEPRIERAAAPRRSAIGGSAGAPASSGSATIAEEAETLRRVGQALRSGQLGLAREFLDDLDARVPRGSLVEERAAARLMVRCRSGDWDARVEASTWLEHHPRSVYAPRVRSSCSVENE